MHLEKNLASGLVPNGRQGIFFGGLGLKKTLQNWMSKRKIL